jgi:hypothetical protein
MTVSECSLPLFDICVNTDVIGSDGLVHVSTFHRYISVCVSTHVLILCLPFMLFRHRHW